MPVYRSRGLEAQVALSPFYAHDPGVGGEWKASSHMSWEFVRVVVNSSRLFCYWLGCSVDPFVEGDGSGPGYAAHVAYGVFACEAGCEGLRYVVDVYDVCYGLSIAWDGHGFLGLCPVEDVGFTVEVVVEAVDYGGPEDDGWEGFVFVGLGRGGVRTGPCSQDRFFGRSRVLWGRLRERGIPRSLGRRPQCCSGRNDRFFRLGV